MEQKPLLLIITGPTAVGKTDLAIRLAKQYNTQIISCDSRQIYSEMSIGTAKPSVSQLQDIKHHFIDHISIQKPFTAADFKNESFEKLKELFQEKKIVVLTGGTGLYISALIDGLDEFPKVSEEIIEKYNSIFNKEGLLSLQKRLQKVDPIYYEQVDIHNSRRLIRALSVYEASNQPFSSFLQKDKFLFPYDYLYIILNRPREELYLRINKRVDAMLEDGLIAEAKNLYKYKELTSLKTVGYQELFKYFDEEWTLEEAVIKIKQHSRNYAKRQLTWFRKLKNAIWLESNEQNFDDIIKLIDERKHMV